MVDLNTVSLSPKKILHFTVFERVSWGLGWGTIFIFKMLFDHTLQEVLLRLPKNKCTFSVMLWLLLTIGMKHTWSIMLLSPCLNVQLLEGDGDRFKVTFGIRQVMVGRRKGCMWGGLTSIFIDILYENVWKSKSNLKSLWSTSACSTSYVLVTQHTCGILSVLTFLTKFYGNNSFSLRRGKDPMILLVWILHCLIRNGKMYHFTVKILENLYCSLRMGWKKAESRKTGIKEMTAVAVSNF